MSMRHEKDAGLFAIGRALLQKKGAAKITILLSLAAFFLIGIMTTAVRQTAAVDVCDYNGCAFCHGDQHGSGWQGCSSCHDSPPQTASHRTHYGSDPVLNMQYGDTGIARDTNNYKFGCGNCHPRDNAKHRDGTLQVELYDSGAPADSIKAKNPSDAEYTPGPQITTYAHKLAEQPDFSYSNGTCSNVYCHSGYVVTSSGPVGNPLTVDDNPAFFPPGYKVNKGFIMDGTCSSLQYASYTVNTGREYQTTPAWGTTGTFSLCTECHQFPLWTDYTRVQAGVGDSHYWINEYGYAYGHNNNMEYFPGIHCATCHYGTADYLPGSVANPPTAHPTTWQQVSGYFQDPIWLQVYSPVPLKSRVMHVNGKPDVSFDTVNGYRYYYPNYLNIPLSLTTATYDPATKTCSDVACHYGPPLGYNQKEVKWGSPYRGWEGPASECDQCHRYGDLNKTCTTP